MKMLDSPYAQAVAVKPYPVQKEEDVWKLELPDPKTAGDIPTRIEYCKLREKAGLPINFFARAHFNMAADFCSYEQYAR